MLVCKMAERRRVCTMQRGENGFGFVLCCENDSTDTYVLHVLNSSPSSRAGLTPGDKIVEVNGVNVEAEEHKLVVQRLQGLQSVRLLVAHCNTAEEYFKEPGNGMTVKPLEEGGRSLRPKLITIKKGEKGFDFALQTVGKSSRDDLEWNHRVPLKGITGHYATKVRKEGAAYKAGLREGNRVIQINGVQVEQECHAYVIAAIKSSSNLELLVVDKETDEFFQTYGVSPTLQHINGEVEFRTPNRLCRSFEDSYERPMEDVLNPTRNYHKEPMAPPSTQTQLSRLYRSQPAMAMSTPNLTSLGTSRRSRSLFSFNDRASLDESSFKMSAAARAKRKIMKQLSKLERKPSKSRLYRVNLLGSRKLYDDTVISDETESTTSSSPPSTTHRFSQLSIQHQPRSRFSQSVIDLSQYNSHSYKSFPRLPKQNTELNYERTDCDVTTKKNKPSEELANVGYMVDLKTLKERVRKKSSQSKSEMIRSKSKLSDYELAHLYVNSY